MIKIEFLAQDASIQPALFQKAANNNRPLLVALHTWSFDMYNQVEFLSDRAKKDDWNLLLPNYRGANKATNPDHLNACGSKAAISDIILATEYAVSSFDLNNKEIYLFGGSGGGHAALLATAYKPELWNTVISYVPIVDLRKWHAYCKTRGLEFYKDIEACIGQCTPDNHIYEERSPISYLDRISKVNRLKIFAGKFDTIVDISQSLDFFNEMQLKHPTANIFLEIFEGGHFVNYDSVINYLNDKGLVGMLDLSQ